MGPIVIVEQDKYLCEPCNICIWTIFELKFHYLHLHEQTVKMDSRLKKIYKVRGKTYDLLEKRMVHKIPISNTVLQPKILPKKSVRARLDFNETREGAGPMDVDEPGVDIFEEGRPRTQVDQTSANPNKAAKDLPTPEEIAAEDNNNGEFETRKDIEENQNFQVEVDDRQCVQNVEKDMNEIFQAEIMKTSSTEPQVPTATAAPKVTTAPPTAPAKTPKDKKIMPKVSCDYCPKSFRYQACLGNHLDAKHEGKNYDGAERPVTLMKNIKMVNSKIIELESKQDMAKNLELAKIDIKKVEIVDRDHRQYLRLGHFDQGNYTLRIDPPPDCTITGKRLAVINEILRDIVPDETLCAIKINKSKKKKNFVDVGFSDDTNVASVLEKLQAHCILNPPRYAVRVLEKETKVRLSILRSIEKKIQFRGNVKSVKVKCEDSVPSLEVVYTKNDVPSVVPYTYSEAILAFEDFTKPQDFAEAKNICNNYGFTTKEMSRFAVTFPPTPDKKKAKPGRGRL